MIAFDSGLSLNTTCDASVARAICAQNAKCRQAQCMMTTSTRIYLFTWFQSIWHFQRCHYACPVPDCPIRHQSTRLCDSRPNFRNKRENEMVNSKHTQTRYSHTIFGYTQNSKLGHSLIGARSYYCYCYCYYIYTFCGCMSRLMFTTMQLVHCLMTKIKMKSAKMQSFANVHGRRDWHTFCNACFDCRYRRHVKWVNAKLIGCNYLANVFDGAHIAVTDTDSGIYFQIVDIHTRIHDTAAMRTMTNHAIVHSTTTVSN